MLDLLMVGLLALGFAGAVGYVRACTSMTGSEERQNQRVEDAR